MFKGSRTEVDVLTNTQLLSTQLSGFSLSDTHKTTTSISVTTRTMLTRWDMVIMGYEVRAEDCSV